MAGGHTILYVVSAAFIEQFSAESDLRILACHQSASGGGHTQGDTAACGVPGQEARSRSRTACLRSIAHCASRKTGRNEEPCPNRELCHETKRNSGRKVDQFFFSGSPRCDNFRWPWPQYIPPSSSPCAASGSLSHIAIIEGRGVIIADDVSNDGLCLS